MNIKRVLLVVGLVLAMSMPLFAQGRSSQIILVNGKEAQVSAQIKDGRTMLPLRDLCELLEIEITGFQDGIVSLQKGDNKVELLTRGPYIVNASGYFKSDVVPIMIQGTTYIPVRVISYMFGYDVGLSNNKLTMTSLSDWSIPKASYESFLYLNDADFAADMYHALKSAVNYSLESLRVPNAYIAEENAQEVLYLREDIKNSQGKLKTNTAKELSLLTQELLFSEYKTLMHLSRYEYKLLEYKSYDRYYEKNKAFYDNIFKYATPVY